MMPNYYQKYIDRIKSATNIPDSSSFYLLKLCSKLLYSDDEEKNMWGRRLVINVLDNWYKLPEVHFHIWSDLVESAGFYPYTEKLILKDSYNFCTPQHIRKVYHSSEYLRDTYFHEEQKELANLLNAGKNVIVSAPTSFGKSLLIEDLVASKRFNNIVVIQPTLALLDETRKKLKRYRNDYKIIVRTTQKASSIKRNLFLLTAERVMEYKDLPSIDFFVIDEFYKLSAKRDDERSDVLNNAFHFLISQNSQFYLLGPNIDGISKGFAEKYDAYFIITNYSLVDNQIIDIYEQHKEVFDNASHHAKKGYKDAIIYRDNVLFNLLLDLKKEQTMIYCSSPERARKMAKKFTVFLQTKDIKENENLNIIEWITENISKKWSIVDCLKLGIGVHDGALPKHMTSTIISYFNNQKLKYLFCTSTIIEGVNTSAKNIVYFDSKKGKQKIDYFDYANIRGRSGRMMIHYVGKIYNFNSPPEKGDVIIDIPFFEQNPVTSEVLIHLNSDEIIDKNSSDYLNILSIPDVEKEIIKKNGLLVTGQQKILEILKVDMLRKSDLILWQGMPTYHQLAYLILLAWNNLLKPGESTSPYTVKQIVKITSDYGRYKSIQYLIRAQNSYFQTLSRYKSYTDEEIYDDAIRFALQAMKHWFGYKIPKWIQTINKLQKHVATLNNLNAGEYSFYASQIENDFIQPNLMILNEYGVPNSAIKKIENNIDKDWTEEQVLSAVKRSISENRRDFLDYEADKINDVFSD